ncbi:ADP-ribose glycohydrolase OARD1-like [Haliotis cracherodii]|uniref:ADP-ribose glycohydrolase OARD1-like n=1 Tax=Haliotis cracherodii TaxID=6455 RepID=UPI0039E986B7
MAEASGFQFVEMKGDLFKCPETDAIVHCVSQDMHMGKGIAVLFKKTFGGVEELRKQGKKPGETAVLKRGSRYVYYLVTKPKYFNKPTYGSLTASLEDMKKHVVENNVVSISMPRIGCGLDRLQWPKVTNIITDVFSDTNVKVTAYTL